MATLEGEYAEKGEYHRTLDKNWLYYPVYVEKMRAVEAFMQNVPKTRKILDLGCGEGVLVEKYRKQGYDIAGLDYQFSSESVMKGNILHMTLEDNSYDLVLLFDVLEHFSFGDQRQALKEINRILKPGGKLFMTVPNLGHLANRFYMLLTGKPKRTALIPERHPGDRALPEYLSLLREEGFSVLMKKGIFPTLPLITLATYLKPSVVLPIHRIYNKICPVPSWSFLNMLYLKTEK